jgi:hypothetical protein
MGARKVGFLPEAYKYLSLFTIERKFELSRHPSDIARNVLFALSCTYRVELPLSSEQVLVPTPHIGSFMFRANDGTVYSFLTFRFFFYCSYAASSKSAAVPKDGSGYTEPSAKYHLLSHSKVQFSDLYPNG